MNIAAYDFTRPARLPPDVEQRLGAWFRGALELVLRAWGREFGLQAEGQGGAAEVQRLDEAAVGLAPGLMGYRIVLGPRELPSLLLLPRPVLDVLLATLLGETAEETPAERELTDIERSLLDFFLQAHWLPAFKDTWPGPVQLVWQLRPAQEYPRCLQGFEPGEELVVFRCVLGGAFREQTCVWLFRKSGLQELCGKGTVEVATPPAEGPRLEDVVRGLGMDLVVRLGQVELRLAELAQLRPGDVVLLNQRVGDTLPVLVGEKVVYRAWPGRTGPAKAFRIEELAEV
jgi:flagellar motor switch/type III secretory pathway protein FliN